VKYKLLWHEGEETYFGLNYRYTFQTDVVKVLVTYIFCHKHRDSAHCANLKIRDKEHSSIISFLHLKEKC